MITFIRGNTGGFGGSRRDRRPYTVLWLCCDTIVTPHWFISTVFGSVTPKKVTLLTLVPPTRRLKREKWINIKNKDAVCCGSLWKLIRRGHRVVAKQHSVSPKPFDRSSSVMQEEARYAPSASTAYQNMPPFHRPVGGPTSHPHYKGFYYWTTKLRHSQSRSSNKSLFMILWSLMIS